MKDILLIGGPSTLSGVDRINDGLLSILRESHLYDRKAVIVWPTPDFLEPPTDTKDLQPYVDMNATRWQVVENRGMTLALKGLTNEQIKSLPNEAGLDPKALCGAVDGDNARFRGMGRIGDCFETDNFYNDFTLTMHRILWQRACEGGL